MRIRSLVAVGLVAPLVLLAACGGGDDDDTDGHGHRRRVVGRGR